MTTGYREAGLLCPGCGAGLDPKNVGESIIDVCPACQGIWVDWFDGDLVQMVRGAPPGGGPAAPDGRGTSACPRCRRELGWESYQASGAQVLRCADCAGVFVPGTSIRALVARAGSSAEHAPQDAFSKLAMALERWLGWDEG